MSVSYMGPLRRSWSRMSRMLFRPFQLETWASLGFAAFLAEYLSRVAGGGKFSWRGRSHAPFAAAIGSIAAFLQHPLWGPLVIALTILGALCALIFMWLSSRGKFVFLDNVVREQPAIAEPWRRLAAPANSLFVFWLGLAIVSISVLVVITLPLLPAVLAATRGGVWSVLGVFTVGWWLAAVVPFAFVVAYTHLFLFQFVVPIMYRDRVGVLAAWRRFLPLFRSHPVEFLAFGLYFLLLLVVVGQMIATVGLSTCCLGFVLLWLPYVGSVLTLPIEVTLRGLGPEFLAQFGPEWSVFPASAAPSPARGKTVA